VAHTAGEEHVDVEFHSFLYAYRRSHTHKLLKNRCLVTSKTRYIITLTQVPLLDYNTTGQLSLASLRGRLIEYQLRLG